MKIDIRHNSKAIADAIAKAPEQVLPEIDRAMMRGAIEMADQIKIDAPKFRSELTNSIQVVSKPLEHVIRANAQYAGYVEHGTGKGGRPTLKELMDWIRLKRITPRSNPRMNARQLAHVIRHKIAQRGIAKQPFFFSAAEKKRSRLTELLELAAARGLAKVGT